MLIDTHAHLDDEAFRGDLDAVLQRAQQMGVGQVLTVGTDLASSRAAVALAERYDRVFAAVGVHPNTLNDADTQAWAEVERLADHPRVVAIGETGLDLFRKRTPLDRQRQWLDRHIALSRRTGRPVIIHCRAAEKEMLDALGEAHAQGPFAAVMHCFSGGKDTLEACLGLGLYVSIAGPVTFPKSQALRELASAVPPDRLLVETDSPYLAPQARRGQRNEPGFVRFTAEVIARARHQTLTALASETTANARRLFSLPDPGAP